MFLITKTKSLEKNKPKMYFFTFYFSLTTTEIKWNKETVPWGWFHYDNKHTTFTQTLSSLIYYCCCSNWQAAEVWKVRRTFWRMLNWYTAIPKRYVTLRAMCWQKKSTHNGNGFLPSLISDIRLYIITSMPWVCLWKHVT